MRNWFYFTITAVFVLILFSPTIAEELSNPCKKKSEETSKDMREVLKAIGLKARDPGEAIETWQKRSIEEYQNDIERIKKEKELLEKTFKDFLHDISQGNTKPNAKWGPTFEESCPVVFELGLSGMPDARLLALKILQKYLQDPQMNIRLNQLKLDSVNIYRNTGAVFMVDTKEIYSVFVWHNTGKRWVLTGVAGGERMFFIQVAQRLHKNIIQAEKEARSFVTDLVNSRNDKPYFSHEAKYLAKVWMSLKEDNLLQGAKIENVHLDIESLDAEVGIQVSEEHWKIKLKRTSQGYWVTYINFNATGKEAT